VLLSIGDRNRREIIDAVDYPAIGKEVFAQMETDEAGAQKPKWIRSLLGSELLLF